MQRIVKISGFNTFTRKSEGLCTTLKTLESSSARIETEVGLLKIIVRRSYELCTPDGQSLEETLVGYGLYPKKALQDKTIE